VLCAWPIGKITPRRGKNIRIWYPIKNLGST